ncbi:MAG: thioredoxin [Lachnospiraceae bacterium]|nr:thioredoxin [Lachnospiraceae bacterium]
MAAIHLTEENFNKEVLEAEETVLVDFWAPWCGPCRMVLPIIEELADSLTDVKIGKINVDEEMELAGRYRVMTIPTLMVFKNGQPVETSIGAKSKAEILRMIGK